MLISVSCSGSRGRTRKRKAEMANRVHLSSKTKGLGEKGVPRNHPEISCLRNWSISSADFSMTPMEGAEHYFGPFRRRILGKDPAAPCSPGSLFFNAELNAENCVNQRFMQRFQGKGPEAEGGNGQPSSSGTPKRSWKQRQPSLSFRKQPKEKVFWAGYS